MSKFIYIYEIFYLENNIPFYIGKSVNPIKRKYNHTLKFGKNINLNIIDKVLNSEWKFWEIYYISLYKSWGFKLENKNNGGGGPTNWTDEQKHDQSVRLSNKNHSKYYTKEVRKQMSESNKGKAKFKGKKHSEESKLKASLSTIGKPKSKEHIENMMKNRQVVIDGVRKAKSKPVLQYDLEGNFIKEWDGTCSASKELNIKSSCIYNCLLNVSQSAGKFKWKYDE